MIDFLKEKIEFDDFDDVLKLHLIIKCRQYNVKISEADLDSLIELYKNGYNNAFFKNCVIKDYYKSEQTVRNAVTRMTNLGILTHVKRGDRIISKDFTPNFKSNRVIVEYLIRNK